MAERNPVFLLMPEWQGSPSSRAMRLIDGAEALRDDLPAVATREVEVPLEAGDSLGTPVARLSSLLQSRAAVRRVLDERPGGAPPILLGGGCSTSLHGIDAAMREHGAANIAVLWFDAHPDLQHPSTSPSGAASGMTLRHALGDGAADLALDPALDPRQIALVGTRALDPEEKDEISSRGISMIDTAADAAALADAVRDRLLSSGATHVYVHVDLDVLDPAEFSAVQAPVPFGLRREHLTTAIRAAVAALPLAGAAICEFAPPTQEAAADDLPTVLRLLAALTSGGGR